MKIVSKYRDYYDAQAYIYGIDDHIVYARGDLTQKEQSFQGEWSHPDYEIVMPKGLEHVAPHASSLSSLMSGNILVICGKAYSLIDVKCENEWKPRLEVFHPVRHAKQLAEWKKQRWNPKWLSLREEEEVVTPSRDRPQSPFLIEVSRQIEQPVFIIKSSVHGMRGILRLEGQYKPLSEMAVAPWYPMEQIFQDLSYFITNQVNSSPDMMPSPKPPQTDREKLLAHGMDARYSFRHRK
jgi:hypothetical protein